MYQIFINIKTIEKRKDESFRVLKKGLAYGLSVAIAAYPEKGKQIFSELIEIKDKDTQWILKENLKKNRLIKMDKTWVEQMYIACS